jgi:UDP-N-acetyl-D-glucosamine dehydrogenase
MSHNRLHLYERDDNVKDTARLRRRILGGEATVAVIGQGYVGLSLACAAAECGFRVTGIDVNETRVADLAAGTLSVPGVNEELFRAGVAGGRVQFTTETDALATSDVILICVPTPLRDEIPDLSFVERAAREVSRHLSPGRLVVLESTTYPGTTEDLVRPILEESGLVAGHDFLLAYSPERIDPGNGEFDLRNTPKIVGGLTPEATGIASLFYDQIVDKVQPVSSARTAELAKLLENTFRHVNIALVNEMAILCHEMGIDVWEVIEATATKPFGFMPFYPGPGVGGHCIPLDPTYLSWQVRRDAGRQFRILEQAQDINTQMPSYVVARIGDALNEVHKSVKGACILVLGVAYKPDVGDVRESPSMKVIAQLHRRGAEVCFHDPYVPEVTLDGGLLPRTELTQRVVATADCVVLLTPHHAYDLDWLAEHAQLIFDARNAFGPDRRSNVVPL